MDRSRASRVFVVLPICVIIAYLYPYFLEKKTDGPHVQLQHLAEHKMQQSLQSIIQLGSQIVQDAKRIVMYNVVTHPTMGVDQAEYLPAEIVYGVINDQDIYQVKIGPFDNAAFARALMQRLVDHRYDVTLKVDQFERQKQFTAFVNPTCNEVQAFETRDNLDKKEHIQGVVVKSFN